MQFESAERKKRSAFLFKRSREALFQQIYARENLALYIISYREAACGGTCSNIEHKSRACGN